MGLSLCKCCCWTKRNRVIHSKTPSFSILLLGQENVGKTEIGYVLAGKTRKLFEPTNGVQCYQMELPNYTISITEIGGNSQMQKLWHHYYAKTMGLIFCYDMSASLENMQQSFELLNQIASHPYMKGKAVLLIGTKSDLVSDTIQLYDIENTFAIESLANRYCFSLKSTHFNPNELSNLWNGIDWLATYLEHNQKHLRGRLNYDMMRERVLKKHHLKRMKFSVSYRRPKTAPAIVCRGYDVPTPDLEGLKNVFRVAHDDKVPSNTEIS